MACMYQVGDLALRLNVAAHRHLKSVRVVHSSLTLRLLYVLYANGVIRGFTIKKKFVLVFLKYYLGKSVFSSITLISKPGCRIYWSLRKLSLVYNFSNFTGFYIISSPRGFITSTEALLGVHSSGEVLLKVTL